MNESKLCCTVNGSIDAVAQLKDHGGWWEAIIELACDRAAVFALFQNEGPLRLADGTMDTASWVNVHMEDGRDGRAFIRRMCGEEVRGSLGPNSDHWRIEVTSQTPLTHPAPVQEE